MIHRDKKYIFQGKDMIALTYSSIALNQPHISDILVPSVIKKKNLLPFTIKILVFILLYHIFFNYGHEKEAEIEEKELDLVVMVSPAIKRNMKKPVLSQKNAH